MVSVTFINVGYGDSIFIELKEKESPFRILVDGGTYAGEHFTGHPQRIPTYEYLRSQKINSLDVLVITHLHEDHVAGLLPVVQNLPIRECWCNYLPEPGLSLTIPPLPSFAPEGAKKLNRSIQFFGRILDCLTQQGTDIREITKTELDKSLLEDGRVDIFSEAPLLREKQRQLISRTCTASNPIERIEAMIELDAFINLTSLIVKVKSGKRSILLGGDVYAYYWEPILDKGIDISADILKLPHHGHGDSASPRFAEAVHPSHVVVCVSNDRQDNCPDRKIMELFGGTYPGNGSVQIHFTDAVQLAPYTNGSLLRKAIVFSEQSGKAGFEVRSVL